jgi:cation diffusion facilitator family transporter
MAENTQLSDRYREIRRVTLVGSAVDLALGIIKILVGIIGSSQALLADGIHSLSDLATDFMVLFAAKHASRDADEEHPYGHGRFETVATVALGVALVLVAIGIAYDAIRRLFAPELLLHPGVLALIVAAISILSKEAIYHYSMVIARKYRSKMLRANAWHSRTDAISSVIVFIGVLGSMAGLEYLDAIAAVGVALMIIKIGWDLSWHSIRELVDTALDPEDVEHIRDMIMSVDGVLAMHMLRTRRMGSDSLVDVHIQVDSHVSVSEGHQISEAVRQKLIGEIEHVADVMVHIDPEDDEDATPCCSLPLRQGIMAHLDSVWGDMEATRLARDVVLHYLDGKVEVELTLPLKQFASQADMEQFSTALTQRVAGDPLIRSVKVNFS